MPDFSFGSLLNVIQCLPHPLSKQRTSFMSFILLPFLRPSLLSPHAPSRTPVLAVSNNLHVPPSHKQMGRRM